MHWNEKDNLSFEAPVSRGRANSEENSSGGCTIAPVKYILHLQIKH